MALLVVCTGCGKEVDSGETKGVKCLDCRIKQVLEPYKQRMAQLQAKANRYGDKGVSLKSIREQARRIYARAELKALIEALGNREKVAKIMNIMFEGHMEKKEEPELLIPDTGKILELLGKKNG